MPRYVATIITQLAVPIDTRIAYPGDMNSRPETAAQNMDMHENPVPLRGQFVSHIVVSPHLDDGILSCGGTVATLVSQGVRPVIVTIFAGDPFEDERSPYAAALERRWQLTARPVETRRSEDRDACGIVGAEPVHLAFVDAVYRRRRDGRWRSETRSDLFSGLQPDDVELVARVAAALGELCSEDSVTCLWAPTALGGHVDHLIARKAAEETCRVPHTRVRTRLLRYEDMPYATAIGDQDVAELARREGGRPYRAACTPESWDRKLRAIRAYTSQQPTLWPGDASVDDLTAYAIGSVNGLGERFWH